MLLMGGTPEEQTRHQQLGYLRDDGSVETGGTPGANNVNLLAEMCVLNYMALHGEQSNFAALYPTLGNSVPIDTLTAFTPIVNGTISNPV